MPIMHDNSLLWVLSFQDIIARLVDQPQIDTHTTKLSDIDINIYVEYKHIAAHQSIYEVQTVFVEHEDIEVLLITTSWSIQEPLMWVISVHDLPKLSKKIESTGA